MANYSKKLDEDLTVARKLLDDWLAHPEEVFVKYGLAEKTADVKITKKVSGCSCGCCAGARYEADNC